MVTRCPFSYAANHRVARGQESSPRNALKKRWNFYIYIFYAARHNFCKLIHGGLFADLKYAILLALRDVFTVFNVCIYVLVTRSDFTLRGRYAAVHFRLYRVTEGGSTKGFRYNIEEIGRWEGQELDFS